MAYEQDVIAPVTITHGLEFGVADENHRGMFGYHYNFLDYAFEEGDRQIGARHYLDEPDCAYLALTFDKPDEFLMRVLIFLMMRFETIKSLTRKGYEPISPEIAEAVRERLDLHMRSAAGG